MTMAPTARMYDTMCDVHSLQRQRCTIPCAMYIPCSGKDVRYHVRCTLKMCDTMCDARRCPVRCTAHCALHRWMYDAMCDIQCVYVYDVCSQTTNSIFNVPCVLFVRHKLQWSATILFSCSIPLHSNGMPRTVSSYARHKSYPFSTRQSETYSIAVFYKTRSVYLTSQRSSHPSIVAEGIPKLTSASHQLVWTTVVAVSTQP
jgi:hypothetical protein